MLSNFCCMWSVHCTQLKRVSKAVHGSAEVFYGKNSVSVCQPLCSVQQATEFPQGNSPGIRRTDPSSPALLPLPHGNVCKGMHQGILPTSHYRGREGRRTLPRRTILSSHKIHFPTNSRYIKFQHVDPNWLINDPPYPNA